jgi:hypothetical protein
MDQKQLLQIFIKEVGHNAMKVHKKILSCYVNNPYVRTSNQQVMRNFATRD